MQSITCKAYAKINLALDVLGRRPDGYHEVKMVMQTIGLYDELIFEKIAFTDDSGPIKIETSSSAIPTDENNLVYRAAAAIFARYKPDCGIKITLTKNIPVAAGMAGGSTDAAAVFHGLNALFGLKMTVNEMCEMGVKIGADVPYCIIGGIALAEGIGEELTPLPPPPPCQILIVKPDISVSTKWVYENLKVNELEFHPDINGMIAAIHHQDLDGIIKKMGNVLETVTIEKYPVIKEIKNKLLAFGAENALMSGSGPTVFAIFRNEAKAQAAYIEMRDEYEVYLTKFVNRKDNYIFS
ncbi:MAG: 4-(cytidine 5'-diphospho)-2-C-methyl-D-erythritol kinase [Lachnospiraceae bacterium]|nr:4-(cytidine 5'-diphospho)-2-C-methyl-D-erythritol kinase [Lachnospiraceae bacterium]